MIRSAIRVLWILLLIPAITAWADVAVPGPPSSDKANALIGVGILAAGVFGLAMLRRNRTAGEEEAAEAPRSSGRTRMLRVVCWLLVLAGPAFYVLRASAESSERKKVQRTMADMRRIATAWEARAVQTNRYNAAGSGITFVARGEKVPRALPYAITSEEAARLLVPTYMNAFPMRDAWGNEWLLALDQPYAATAGAPAGSYAIASPGRDGRFGAPVNGNEPCAAWECDLVFSNGEFITRFPAGESREAP